MSVQQRIKRGQKALRQQEKDSALLLSSACQQTRNRDNRFPYRPDSDFFYLSGSKEPGLTLLIFAEAKTKPILFAPPDDPVQTLWEGEPENPKTIARRIGAQLELTKNPESSILENLRGKKLLAYSSLERTAASRIAQRLFTLPSWGRHDFPSTFLHSDAILEPLRLKKEASEIRSLQHSADLICDALFSVRELIRPGVFEYEIAAALGAFLESRQATHAFQPIVASGSNAAVLHYHQNSARLKKGDLLLIDCGAELNMYCSDITRVFPIGKPFSSQQAKLYDAVQDAKQSALRTIREGTVFSRSYKQASLRLLETLKELKLVKGSLPTLFKKDAQRRFFPHGLGHSLGLDVHDIGSLRANSSSRLASGMVITIEPGLYFPKKLGRIPACGIRLEDDVVVRKKGFQVLTRNFPCEREEIEDLVL